MLGALACLECTCPHVPIPFRILLSAPSLLLMPTPNGHTNECPNEQPNEHGPCAARAAACIAEVAEAARLRSLWLRVNRLERLMQTARRAQRPQWHTYAEQALHASNEYMRRSTG